MSTITTMERKVESSLQIHWEKYPKIQSHSEINSLSKVKAESTTGVYQVIFIVLQL